MPSRGRVGRFSTGPRFFEGPKHNNPTNNHLLIQDQIRKDNELLGINPEEANIVYRHDITEDRRTVEPSRQMSIVDRKVSQRIDQLHSTLQSHAAQSARIERELNRVLRMSEKGKLSVQGEQDGRRSRSGTTTTTTTTAAATTRRDQWGEPPPKPLPLRLQQKQHRLPSISPVATDASRASAQRRRLSTAEQRQKAARGRAEALRRVRRVSMQKGKTIPTNRREAIKARELRARTSNLNYGF